MRKKKLYQILALPVACVVAGLLMSCADEYSGGLQATVNPHYLNVDKTSLSFSASASTQDFNIKSVATPWQLTSNSDWISVSPDAGESSSSVNVSVADNPVYNTSGRAAALTLASTSGESITRHVAINQESPELLLELSTKEITFPASVSLGSINVNANSDWDFAVTDDSWLTASKSGNSLTISVSTNATGATRTAYISIMLGSKSERVTVRQQAANVSVSSDILNFGFVKSSKLVSVSSDIEWTAKTNDSWINIAPVAGVAGTTDIKVEVADNFTSNTRTGYITVDNKSISVVQEGVQLSVSPSSIEFGEDEETRELEVSSNTNWTITPSRTTTWLSVTPTSGKGNGKVTVTAYTNEDATREGRLLITCDLSGMSTNVDVSQTGKGIIPYTGLAPFSKEGGSIDFEPTSLQFSIWTANVVDGEDWIHVSPSSGNSNAKMNIKVDATTIVADRTGYILLTFDNDKKYKVFINQYGAGLLVETNKYDFFAKGGDSTPITVEYVGQIEIDSSAPEWLTARLMGNLLVFSATENLSGNIRQATVYLKQVGTENTARIAVSQASQHGAINVNGYDSEDEKLIK